MAGLFPPRGNQRWNKNINWQPIPVHTVPEDQDYIIGSSPSCNRLDDEMNRFYNSTEYISLLEKYQSLIRYLEENSGMKLQTLNDLNHLYEELFVEQLKGYKYVIFQLIVWSLLISNFQVTTLGT